ncbi:MAG: hypothetical protein HC933_10310 [Pleurocapsa sp. SU_196_0]|nr:hypothetical protein [Pleurocapsa sp. SU_196_0]
MSPVASDQWTATIRGHEIQFEARDVASVGYGGHDGLALAVGQGNRCSITLSRTAVNRLDLAAILAHEVGHCLDHLELGWSHNGFRDEGRLYGEFFGDPAEGYAETYGRAYLETCGTLLEPLGWKFKRDGACDLPAPHAVTPSMVR